MSHQPERKEKDCLNCGAMIHGRFCHVCGQENIVPHQSFWSLTRHFIYDILHFDGKFYDTVKYLFTRPGYVPKLYVQGKRMRFLDPIRMYLFTSAVFFLVFFTLTSGVKELNQPITPEDRKEMIGEFQKELRVNPGDSITRFNLSLLKDTSRTLFYKDLKQQQEVIRISNTRYSTKEEYDSVQRSLPSEKRDNWLTRKLVLKDIQIREKYQGSNLSANAATVNAFLHSFPYLLFVSLPFFALILKLLYIRRKNFYYNDHAIFTLFHYVLSFMLIFLILIVDRIHDEWPVRLLKWISVGIFFAWLVYLYLEMKNFYGQGKWKTFFKFMALNVLGLFLLLTLFFVFLIISFINM